MPSIRYAIPGVRLVRIITSFVLVGLLFTVATHRASSSEKARRAVKQLANHLNQTGGDDSKVTEQVFADVPLTKQAAKRARNMLWKAHKMQIRKNRKQAIKNRAITVDGTTMKFFYNIYGDAPENGRSLFISMHGGGGAPKDVNDRQWENQKKLYKPEEGVYLAPRAPTNDWNLWHKAHVDQLFGELIETLIVFENVNPNRVYLMGFSAGGDGVYQLAPRMADRWAAASMMAGHPNNAKPFGFRNVPFTIHVGENDSSYDRNKVARKWKKKLKKLRKKDPNGYNHWVKLHKGKGHWMDKQDAAALPWMAKNTRNPHPKRVAWHQDSVLHERMYWLAVKKENVSKGDRVVAAYDGQTVRIEKSDVSSLKIRLNGNMMNLNQPVRVQYQGKTVYQDTPKRTIGTIARTLKERGDPVAIYTAEIKINLEQ